MVFREGLQQYHSRTAVLEGFDLQELHMRFLGEELEVKTIKLSSFQIIDPAFVCPSPDDEDASMQKFDQFFFQDWKVSADFTWANCVNSLIANTMGSTLSTDLADSKNDREYMVKRMLNQKIIFKLCFEQPLSDAFKTISFEILKHYLPHVYKLVLAASVMRRMERETETLGTSFLASFQTHTFPQMPALEEKLNIKFLSCYVAKDYLNKQGKFYKEIVSPNLFKNDQNFLVKYAKVEEFEKGQMWQLITNYTLSTKIRASCPQSTSPSHRRIEFIYKTKTAEETCGVFEVKYLGGEKGVPMKNYVKTLVFFGMFFNSSFNHVLRWLDKHQAVYCKPGDPEGKSGPSLSADISRSFSVDKCNKSGVSKNQSDMILPNSCEINPCLIFKEGIDTSFCIEMLEDTSGEIKLPVLQGGWGAEMLVGISTDSPRIVATLNSMFYAKCKTAFYATLVQSMQEDQAGNSSQSSLVRVVVSSTNSDDQPVQLYKDIQVSRKGTWSNGAPDQQETQLRVNLAAFHALEGWSPALQQLVACEIIKTNFRESMRASCEQANQLKSISRTQSISSFEGHEPQDLISSYKASELKKRGIFAGALLPDFFPVTICVYEQVVKKIRKRLEGDRHFDEQAELGLQKFKFFYDNPNEEGPIGIDNVFRDFLRHSTETSWNYTLTHDMEGQTVQLVVQEVATDMVLWKATVKPNDMRDACTLEKACLRFMNLFTCRLLRKQQFEYISGIPNIKNYWGTKY